MGSYMWLDGGGIRTHVVGNLWCRALLSKVEQFRQRQRQIQEGKMQKAARDAAAAANRNDNMDADPGDTDEEDIDFVDWRARRI